MLLHEFEAHLRSGEVRRVIEATLAATELGRGALQVARTVVADPTVPDEGRYWALMSVQLFKDQADEVAQAALAALAYPQASLRALAIETLLEMRVPAAAEAIKPLLADHRPNPLDWSEGTTIADAAARALAHLSEPDRG